MPDLLVSTAEPSGATQERSRERTTLEVAPGLEDMLERELGKLLEPGKVACVQEVVRKVALAESFSGPIPPPGHLGKYEAVLPGAADRILKMAEREQEHRINWETQKNRAESAHVLFGLTFGFAVSLALIAAAVYCAYIGNIVIGSLLVGTSALGLVPAFIKGRDSCSRSQPTKPAPTPPKRNRKAK